MDKGFQLFVFKNLLLFRLIKYIIENFIDERLAIIRIKAKFFCISLICAHAPMEEYKDTFYERQEQAYDRCPGHDIKIVLVDFNAKVGRESIFAATVGKRFKHRNIHKATWLSPDGKTRN